MTNLNIEVEWLVDRWFACPFLIGTTNFTSFFYLQLRLPCVLIYQTSHFLVEILHRLNLLAINVAWLPAWFFSLFELLFGRPQNSFDLLFSFLTIRAVS